MPQAQFITQRNSLDYQLENVIRVLRGDVGYDSDPRKYVYSTNHIYLHLDYAFQAKLTFNYSRQFIQLFTSLG